MSGGKASKNVVVVGIGGAGCNMLVRFSKEGADKNMRLVALNTEASALRRIKDNRIKRVLIGAKILRGFSAAGDPAKGAMAAIKDGTAISEAIGRPGAVFLLAGLGGGTGTGAIPIIADIARKRGATVNAIVVYPFRLERIRREKARAAIPALVEKCDSLAIESNDALVKLVPNLPMNEAFRIIDDRVSRYITSRIEESGRWSHEHDGS
jgi:cell division protein FtsZ